MTSIITQSMIVLAGVGVLWMIVHRKIRAAACVSLALVAVFSVFGLVLREASVQSANAEPRSASILISDAAAVDEASPRSRTHIDSHASAPPIDDSLTDDSQADDPLTDDPSMGDRRNELERRHYTSLQVGIGSTTTLSHSIHHQSSPGVMTEDDTDEDGQVTDGQVTDEQVTDEATSSPQSPAPSTAADNGQNETVIQPSSDSDIDTPSEDSADSIPRANSSIIPLEGEELPTFEESLPDHAREWILKGDYDDGAIHYRLAISGPATRMSEAEAELNQMLIAKTDEYIDECFGPGVSDYVHYDVRTIKTRYLVPDKKVTVPRQFHVGVMHSTYAQLAFDEQFRADAHAQWQHTKARNRLMHTGLVAGGVLGLLLTVFGYLRLDHATRGFYSGRLQFLAGGAILTLATVGYLAWRSIPWL